MVHFVACDDVGQRSHRYFVFVGHAATGPGNFIEIAKQRNRGSTNGNVIFD
jgi:hypothetical protein